MIRTLAALLASLTSAFAIAQPAACPPTAQPPSQEDIATGLRQAHDHGFLWRISKDGRDSWLYGTLHVGKLAWAFPGPKVTAALRRSDTIGLEIDLTDPSMQQRMASAMAAQPHHALPAALERRLEQATEHECLKPELLAAMSPEMQIASLTTLVGRRDGLDPAFGIDMDLAGWGHGAKREIVSLESPELQLKLMQSDTAEETVEFVDNSLTEIESNQARTMLVRLARIWADSDWTELSSYESWCECLDTASDRAAMARMLDERNPGMAAAIDALHANGHRLFAAVGSLHMIGPQGLPALLARRGYRVEQVVYDRPKETPP